jgi:ParB family chromosome partitioning protein
MAPEGRRGLGRGLSALLGEEAAGSGGAREAPIEMIRPNPGQPRTHFAEAELAELADSIRRKGLLQPILVRPAMGAPGEYQIVAGERRWRAAQRAGLASVPVLVRELSDVETLEAALIENLQRTDLNPLEEAKAYANLMELAALTQEQVAEAVGKSRSHVANTLRLLHLPPFVQQLVSDRRLSAGHARALLTAADPEALASRILSEGLNVRQAEALAKRAAGAEEASRAARQAKRKSADTMALERDLSEQLGLKVEIADRDGKGEIRIRYASLEQLDDVCRRLGG